MDGLLYKARIFFIDGQEETVECTEIYPRDGVLYVTQMDSEYRYASHVGSYPLCNIRKFVISDWRQ